MTAAKPTIQDPLIPLLEALLEKFHIQIRREPLKNDERLPDARSGLCRIRDRQFLLLDPSEPEAHSIALMIGALKTMDLSDVYLPPSVRDRLENSETDTGM